MIFCVVLCRNKDLLLIAQTGIDLTSTINNSVITITGSQITGNLKIKFK